mmetsp:Transcript_5681/g.13581  ORF Transcript_5681/g.13581 Transcript_5681/m.13581 type:complete len:205 (+) Transcript_5681:408-1022(+)
MFGCPPRRSAHAARVRLRNSRSRRRPQSRVAAARRRAPHPARSARCLQPPSAAARRKSSLRRRRSPPQPLDWRARRPPRPRPRSRSPTWVWPWAALARRWRARQPPSCCSTRICCACRRPCGTRAGRALWCAPTFASPSVPKSSRGASRSSGSSRWPWRRGWTSAPRSSSSPSVASRYATTSGATSAPARPRNARRARTRMPSS